MANFEPYQIYKYMKLCAREDSEYKRLLEVRGMQLDTAAVTQMVKMIDLHCFANTVLELLAAKHEAPPDPLTTRRQKKFNAQRMLTTSRTSRRATSRTGAAQKSKTEPF